MVMRAKVAGPIGLQNLEDKHEFLVYETGRGRGARREKRRWHGPSSRTSSSSSEKNNGPCKPTGVLCLREQTNVNDKNIKKEQG